MDINFNKIFEIFDKKEQNIKSFIPEENKKQRIYEDLEKVKNKFSSSEIKPPLYCLPVGIKDIIITDGFKTKCGSELPADIFNGKEASIVTKLKEAGAVIFGKTVTTEFAYFEPGPTRNPHNYNHTPGGSSSGSAAAVAAGIVPLAFGTQTIGSIIRPAAYCGVIGFKPSYGRIETDGVVPFSVSADHLGFFAENFNLTEKTSSVVCKNWNTNVVFDRKNLTIGAVTGKFIRQADDEMIKFYEQSIINLEKRGHKLVKIDLFGDIEKINSIHRKMIAAEFSQVHKDWFAKYKNLYRLKTAELITEGMQVSQRDLEDAKSQRFELRKHIELQKTLNKIDVWISPATLGDAPEGMATGSPLMNLPWTFSGLPVITFQSGKSVKNLPLALQYTGSFMKDEELLKIAKILFDGTDY